MRSSALSCFIALVNDFTCCKHGLSLGSFGPEGSLHGWASARVVRITGPGCDQVNARLINSGFITTDE